MHLPSSPNALRSLYSVFARCKHQVELEDAPEDPTLLPTPDLSKHQGGMLQQTQTHLSKPSCTQSLPGNGSQRGTPKISPVLGHFT